MRAENIATVTVTLDGRLTYKPNGTVHRFGYDRSRSRADSVLWRRSLHVGSNWPFLRAECGHEGTDSARETWNGSLGCFS